jgi:uncharacterized protein (DUF58 family)
MRRSPKLALYAAFSACSFLAAIAFGRPELVALGAPFVLVLVVGLSLPAPARVAASLQLERLVAIEGDEIDGQLVVKAPAVAFELQLALILPDEVRVVDGSSRPLLRLRGGEERSLPIRLMCSRWGGYRVGDFILRARDRAGLRLRDTQSRGDLLIRVYPQTERLRSLVRPRETQPFAGNWVARTVGEGIEFADIRAFVPGDRASRINWRVSARRQELYVNEQYPERNSDVIIFLDSFAEARGREAGTLDLAVKAAYSLSEHYLATRDRVGLVSFGGLVRWLVPSSGATQLYRIVESLLETKVALSFAWKDISVLPPRSLTPQALVIALSPLLDERSVGALLDLRGRGFDAVVIELSPLAFAERERDPMTELAIRLWRLWRDVQRLRYEQLGVAVVEWDGERPLAAIMEEVKAFRRFARYTSA